MAKSAYRLYRAGPMDGKYHFICMDASSKWPEAIWTPSTSTSNTIELLSEVFSRCGFLETLVNDNRPQFKSKELEGFLGRMVIKHKVTAPFHPATNGRAERYLQTIKLCLKNGTLGGKADGQFAELPYGVSKDANGGYGEVACSIVS
ncbi:uncharacterized protein K02A2.6-like [Ornithodoros turicata]|uniref:uncharacterized protein K02A2.6-like n=1 Tax=Ornithodoros turicata TaxID=34597 RepID=UPI003138B0E2